MSNLRKTDRQIVRDLACRLAEIAADSMPQERTLRVRSLNSLSPSRPMVLAFSEVVWRE